jgi:hypothetical protein
MDIVNQAVHLSGVGKLVATSMQWVIVVEDCKGKSVRLYDGWRAAYAAGGANYLMLVYRSPHGSVKHACVYMRVHTDCKYLTFTFTFNCRLHIVLLKKQISFHIACLQSALRN